MYSVLFHYLIHQSATSLNSKLWWVLLIIVAISGCAGPRYQVISPATYPSIGQQLPQKKLILLDGDQLGEVSVDTFTDLFNRKDWERLNSRRLTLAEPSAQRFVQSVAYLLQKQYDSAYQLLNELPEDAFDCQVQMLKTDCQYEMRRQSSYEAQQHYQQVRDCSKNPIVQSIAHIRYRFIKYDN